jgi:hypothetical protein
MTNSHLQLVVNTKGCISLLLGGGRRGEEGEGGRGVYCQVFPRKKAVGAGGGEGRGRMWLYMYRKGEELTV